MAIQGLEIAEHDLRDLGYRVRVQVVGEVFDRTTGEVVATGDEDEMRRVYRMLKGRES